MGVLVFIWVIFNCCGIAKNGERPKTWFCLVGKIDSRYTSVQQDKSKVKPLNVPLVLSNNCSKKASENSNFEAQ